MKKLFFLSVIAFAFLFSACGNSTGDKTQSTTIDTTQLKTGEAYYQCPMHPEAMSGTPGSCPKCNMDLEKKEKK